MRYRPLVGWIVDRWAWEPGFGINSIGDIHSGVGRSGDYFLHPQAVRSVDRRLHSSGAPARSIIHCCEAGGAMGYWHLL
jgi:hypothetical protein